MEHVRWVTAPLLDQPVLFTAFAGWNDAGDAASSALRFLVDVWGAELVAEIDADDFYDFTQIRPTISDVPQGGRRIEWPDPQVYATPPDPTAAINAPDGGRSAATAALLIGTEPTNRWRAFCQEVVDLAEHLGATRVVHLGALLAEVPHSRPVPISMSGGDARPQPTRARYQGPTGIVGVLHQACREAGLDSISLWASVPTYVSGASSPKAALALVRRVAELLETSVSTGLLEISAQSYELEIDQLVGDDEETNEYVRRLERDYDAEESETAADSLTDEIEKYLRDRRG